jgi:tape measure domain-containing protein
MADPKIKFDILANAEGAPGVDALARSLDNLDAAVDAELAGRAKEVATQLKSLGAQQSAIEQFRQLKERSQAAATALKDAQAAAQAAGRAIASTAEPTRTQTGQLQKLGDAVRAAKQEQLASVQALQAQRQALAAAGVDTQKLTVHQAALSKQTADLAQYGKSIAASYQVQASASVASADTQTRSHKRISEGVRSISDQLAQIQRIASAAIGGQLLGGLAGDVAKTADAYQNLAARIKIVTGEGEAFDAAFQGVFDVATRTNSAVEETGTLFARLVQAGKEIGVTNQQALALTETINQAIQVSGGSAQSSQAAITQLIQGLQGGTLRGEEFNSVMEQAPRLAQALADGLGVTTGELRKQAQAGALTSQVVIQALRGQSQVVEQEFSKLPATVGRAIQNLSTEWTRYVGEVDKANGISSTAANAILLVSRNLDTLGTALYSAGKAALAYKALQLAQTFLGIGQAARASATAKAVETAATVANTTAQAGNTVATRANTASKIENAVAGRAAAAAGSGAASAAGGLAAALGGIKVFALLAVITNLKEIGTWIGEGIAKLQGYGKAQEETEAKIKAQEEALRKQRIAVDEAAQAQQLAADKALGLNAASNEIIKGFEGLIKNGADVKEAMGKVADSLKLSDTKGISEAGAALDALGVRGKVSADQIREALASALKGEDLQRFETLALTAFDGSEQGARRLKAAVDAVALESLRRAGTSVRELETGFSLATTSAINDVEALTRTLVNMGVKGDEASRVLSRSLDKALESANTEKAVRVVIERMEQLGKQGLLTGEQLTGGLEKARQKLDETKPGVSSLDEALRNFGLKTRADLDQTAEKFRASWEVIKNSSTVTLQQKQEAFMKYAEAAIAANGGVANSTLRSQAEMVKLKIEVDGVGKALAITGSQGASSINGIGTAAQQASSHLQEMQRLINITEGGRPKNQLGGIDGAGNKDRGDKALGVGDVPASALNRQLDGLEQLLLKEKAGTLSERDIELARSVLEAATFNYETIRQLSPGARGLNGLQGAEGQVANARRLLTAAQGNAGGPTLGGQSNRPNNPASTSGGSVTVNINMGGRSTQVNTASAEDARALTNLLRDLEDAQRRAV